MAYHRYTSNSSVSKSIFPKYFPQKNTKEQIQIYSLFLRKFFRHNYQLVWHSKFQNACKNFPQQFTTDELLPFLDTLDNQHPHYYNLLDFPSSHIYLTYDSNSIDKSLNLPPPVRPCFHQYNIPPSNETISTVSIQTLPSSSHPVTNLTSSLTQHISPSTSQDTSLNHHNPPSTSQITTINNNPPLSHSPNQYTTPSNTSPAVISNPVQHSTFRIPTLNPIPPPLNTTIPTQFLSQNPPSSPTQNHSNFKQLLPLLNLPHITLIFLFTLLFKTSPLLLFNPLQIPLIRFLPLPHYLSTLLPLILHFLFQPLPLFLLLPSPTLLNFLMA